MPVPKRATRSGSVRGQSTLSFHNKITKSVPNDGTNIDKAAASVVASPASEPQNPRLTEKRVDDGDDALQAEQQIEPDWAQQVTPKSEAEREAVQISDAEIHKYWQSVEKQRRAPRVHQEHLETGEKILRYFDVSSQFGPCIGNSRLKRWHRAERLGLHPPIEVLALLLKEPQSPIQQSQVEGI
ncbi:hypothetical protein CDD81_1577 [Ophiocordyceps australis]|uniref:DNA polymerase delta subunit 4 n=1 Tax=Ophiocordyceps australis TaxID=1399860 RepID=A0A2C5XZH0_9HYPO|nr:hypothetical protein CDD81_1577 [Ophiocordyceps australis]